MIVRVKREDGISEWMTLELHGELTNEENSSENKFVGDMYYLKCGTPVLIIGNHILYGKESKMDKPMAVLEKRECLMPSQYNTVEYTVRAVVRKKITFKTRPKNLTAE